MLELHPDHPYKNGRTCSSCGVKKTADHYQLEKDKKALGGVAMRSVCRPCMKVVKWKQDIKRRYGLTYEGYLRLLAKQEEKCAICRESHNNTSANTHHFFVDHDHVTGEVRGLLCATCNVGVGMFRDNPEVLKRAIQYLHINLV